MEYASSSGRLKTADDYWHHFDMIRTSCMMRGSCGARGYKRAVAATLSGGQRSFTCITRRISQVVSPVILVDRTGQQHLRWSARTQQRHSLHTNTEKFGTATAKQHARASSTSPSNKHHQEAASVEGGATINRINSRTNVLECKLTEGILYMGYSNACTPEVPGNGGLRIGTYSSSGAAMEEAVALTEAMSAKHATYNTGFTGAKLVFDSHVAIPDLCKDTLMREVATLLGTMNGAVYTGCDMNTTHKDMQSLDDMCPYVLAGLGSKINTNVATAAGAFAAVVRTAEQLGLPESFTVHVQGTGNVGANLATRLVEYGATVYTSDVASHRADIAGCTNVSGMDWRKLDVDIFSPNGPAGVIDALAVAEMSCKAIVGAANVPFRTDTDRQAASAKGILIVPHHLASAGAIIIDSLEWNAEDYQSLRPSRAYAFIIDQIRSKVGKYLSRATNAPTTTKCVDHMADFVASTPSAASESGNRSSKKSSGSGSSSSAEAASCRDSGSDDNGSEGSSAVIGKHMERWNQEKIVKKDVVVIGGGMAGTAAAYQLSKLSPELAGAVLEAGEEVAHKGGSSYGTSRMFRQMYSDPYFSDLQAKSMSLWKELEEESETQLLDVNGLLFYGEADTGETVEGSIPGALQVMQDRNIPHKFFDSPEQMAERFSPMKPEPTHIGLFEETAGSVRASQACHSMMDMAQRGGKWDLKVNTRVVDVWQDKQNSEYHVTTADGQNFTAAKLILCPGAWGNDILAHFDLKLDMQVWGVHWGHYNVKEGAQPSQWFHFGKNDALFYGFPVDRPGSSNGVGESRKEGVTVGKVGADFSPARHHYETMESFKYEGDPGVRQEMSDFLAKQWGELYEGEVDMMSSPYAMTKDAMFVLDVLPKHPNVSIFTAGNGRAFKFAPMLGKALANLTLGQEPSFDVSRMKITRPGLLVHMEGGSDGTGNDSDSHDAAYGRAHVPYGAEGAATYSKITLGCFDVVMKARDMIDDSIQALGLPADSLATVRIADFGSADGGPLMPMALHIRSTIPAGCELEVGFEDQPNNDFKSLFYLANGKEELPVQCPPLTSTPGLYFHAVGRSFFEQCFPKESVDVAMSYTALHWMSELPCTIVDHVHHTGTADTAAQARYAKQAAKDWKEILTHRAAELKAGGQMVISTLAKDPMGHYLGWNGEAGFANMFDELNTCWADMRAEGRISQKEYEEASFVNYYRNEEELLAPFENSGSSSGGSVGCVPRLRLKKLDWRTQMCPFGRGRDTPLSLALTVRSWSNSTFLSALDAGLRSAEERAALVDELYKRYEGKIAAEPEHHAMDYVHAYIHFEKEKH